MTRTRGSCPDTSRCLCAHHCLGCSGCHPLPLTCDPFTVLSPGNPCTPHYQPVYMTSQPLPWPPLLFLRADQYKLEGCSVRCAAANLLAVSYVLPCRMCRTSLQQENCLTTLLLEPNTIGVDQLQTMLAFCRCTCLHQRHPTTAGDDAPLNAEHESPVPRRPWR